MLFIFLSMLALICLALAYLLWRVRSFEGESLKRYDGPVPVFATASPSAGLERLNAYLFENFVNPAQSATSSGGWAAKRERFDTAGLSRDFGDVEFRQDVAEMDGVHVPGSWTLVPGHDPARRLLYVHGGGFTVGSDVSHRALTVQLARRTGMAVFAPNYRLMPEHPRMDGIEDCRAAYDWVLRNGPDGPDPAESLVLAGDSAGGNLVLMLSQWARDHRARQPDTVIAISPVTDGTMSSPSLRTNLETDHMLRPMLAPLAKLPRVLLLPALVKHFGVHPTDPVHSPIHGDLSDLPPTLIQASADEVMRDDAIRFANKASAADSPVVLQIWDGGLPHVFQIFDDFIPEAGAALDEIQAFIGKHV